MNTSLFRNWWVILIQGILMIALSILIFDNPGAVLATLALWFGVLILVSGLYGVIAYFATSKQDREGVMLLYSIIMLLIGFLMISNMLVSMIAITIAFGSMVSIVGLILISGSWSGRKDWPMWWLIALLGVATLVVGIYSMIDVFAGAAGISTFIGLSVLFAGFGLIFFAFLKRKVVKTVKNAVSGA